MAGGTVASNLLTWHAVGDLFQNERRFLTPLPSRPSKSCWILCNVCAMLHFLGSLKPLKHGVYLRPQQRGRRLKEPFETPPSPEQPLAKENLLSGQLVQTS